MSGIKDQRLGEESQWQLDTAISSTPRNPSSVSPLIIAVSDPPTQAEVQEMVKSGLTIRRKFYSFRPIP